MASKQIRDECKVGDAVATAGRTWACEIAAKRSAQLAEVGLGGPLTEPSLCQSIERDMGALVARGERLQAADTALDECEGRTPGLLARRDDVGARTLRGLLQVREVVTTFAGEAACRELGFVGSTPRDPVAVEELAARVLERIATAKLTAQVPGVTLDLAAMSAGLAADHVVLVKANADALEAKRVEQLARARRDALWTEYTRERTFAQAQLDAVLRAVGLPDVADRLAPPTRKAPAAESKADAAKPAPKPADAPAKAAPKPDAPKPAEPAPTPAINTRPSLPPASPS